MARCRRAKRSCAYNFRDAKSAFPSLEHHAIVQAFRRRVPRVVSRQFEDLYNRATMVLRLHSGDWRVWKAGRGTRQGDSTGSDIFCATYNEAVIAAKAARPARPHQTLQYSGRTVDPTLLTFVDDIAELTIDEKTKHMEHSIASNSRSKKTLRPLFLRWRRLDASSSSPKRWLFRRGWATAHLALRGWQETREGSRVVPKPLQRDIWEISSTSTAPTVQSFRNASQRLTLDSLPTQECGAPVTSVSRASPFSSKTWCSTRCFLVWRSVFSIRVKSTSCRCTLTSWQDERWAGEVGEL